MNDKRKLIAIVKESENLTEIGESYELDGLKGLRTGHWVEVIAITLLVGFWVIS